MQLDRMKSAFERVLGCTPTVVASAPGRVNLIGEHIDYNGGCVLPFAIPQRVVAAAALDTSGFVAVHSGSLNRSARFSAAIAEPTAPSSWENYIQGMVHELRGLGVSLPGAKLWFDGDLRPGCGLSSSAALCMAAGYALAELAGVEIPPVKMARAGQAAEHRFAGTPCGIMDQYVSCFGRAEQALLIDCNQLTHEYVPFHANGVCVLAIPSGVKHALSDGAYEQRVRSCRTALEVIRRHDPRITSLHEVDGALLERCRGELDDVSQRRARHVVTEVQRVASAVKALAGGDFTGLGTLIWQTQDSLRDDYEVSCAEIDELVAGLRRDERVLGARMIGGGFGGVVIALVQTDDAEAVAAGVRERYYGPRGIAEEMFQVVPSAGASATRL